MTEPKIRVSTSTAQIRMIEVITGLVARVVVGLLFMAGGAWAIYYGLTKDNHQVVIGGIISAVGGAMILPSIFDAVKPVITFVFPNGLPIIGGRRASDPPPPPPSVDIEVK